MAASRFAPFVRRSVRGLSWPSRSSHRSLARRFRGDHPRVADPGVDGVDGMLWRWLSQIAERDARSLLVLVGERPAHRQNDRHHPRPGAGLGRLAGALAVWLTGWGPCPDR